jgi:hypothetical protein
MENRAEGMKMNRIMARNEIPAGLLPDGEGRA